MDHRNENAGALTIADFSEDELAWMRTNMAAELKAQKRIAQTDLIFTLELLVTGFTLTLMLGIWGFEVLSFFIAGFAMMVSSIVAHIARGLNALVGWLAVRAVEWWVAQ